MICCGRVMRLVWTCILHYQRILFKDLLSKYYDVINIISPNFLKRCTSRLKDVVEGILYVIQKHFESMLNLCLVIYIFVSVEFTCACWYFSNFHVNGLVLINLPIKQPKCGYEYWHCKHIVGYCFVERREFWDQFFFTSVIFFSITHFVTDAIVRYFHPPLDTCNISSSDRGERSNHWWRYYYHVCLVFTLFTTI